MKTILHMAAVAAATRAKGELAAYYQRRVKEGKPKMLVLNPVRDKIIHRSYACIRDNRTYEKVYERKLA